MSHFQTLKRGIVAAAFLIVCGGRIMGADIVLLRMEAIQQQDHGDDLSLEVQHPGARPVALGRWKLECNMNLVPVNVVQPYFGPVRVELKERDRRGRIFRRTRWDSLGSIVIRNGPGVWWQDFTCNGAHYRLHYWVRP